jgi:uncharacterized membrane protein YdjX (TVP38/TMEM64 family)
MKNYIKKIKDFCKKHNVEIILSLIMAPGFSVIVFICGLSFYASVAFFLFMIVEIWVVAYLTKRYESRKQ